jgi:hypothetical protein
MIFDMKIKNTHENFKNQLSETEKIKLDLILPKLHKHFDNGDKILYKSYETGIGVARIVIVQLKDNTEIEYDVSDYGCW